MATPKKEPTIRCLLCGVLMFPNRATLPENAHCGKCRLHPVSGLYRNARNRAKAQGVPFTITLQWIMANLSDTCPVLGIKMRSFKGKQGVSDNSWTLDKFEPTKGYTPENSTIISGKANRIKSDASTAEVRALLAWMESRK